MGKAKKIGIGIVAVIVILFVYGTMWSHSMDQASQLLEDIIAECYEKYPTETEEFRDCREGAEEKWREMFSDDPCIFYCPPKN